MNLLSVIWNVSPYVYRFSDTYAIRWYGVLFALGFVFAYYIAYFICRKEQLPERHINKLAIACVVGGVLGARLGHCLFYEPTYYLSDPVKIFHIWEGGMASHGGALGVIIALLCVSTKEYPFSKNLARALMVIPLAGVFFRWGNLMNSEIYGEPTSLPWGFIFESSPEVIRGLEQAVPRHPTQIYEMICYFSLFVIYMLYCWKRLRNDKPISDTFIIGMFGVWVFGGRFMIEFLKMPQVAFEQGLLLNMGQILSLPFIIWGGIALIKSCKEAND